MQSTRRKRTEHIGFVVDPELKGALQRGAKCHDTSMTSAIRGLVRARFASQMGTLR